MKLLINERDASPIQYEQFTFTELLNKDNGCINCSAGVLEYIQDEFIQGSVHEDQEGFYVLQGQGYAKVGDVEFPISPGSCFIVLPGHYHSIKKDLSVPCIKLFYFHAAV